MLLIHGLLFYFLSQAQETFPVNGVADPRTGTYAFTNATIVKDPQTTLQNATLVIKDGKIVSVGNNIAVPKDAVTVDCKGKFIYPSFIDVYSDYGITAPQRQGFGGGFGNTPAQTTSNTKGAFGWNQAIKPETDGSKLFVINEQRAKELRSVGFGTVLTHQQDGIARGTGTVVTLAGENENLVMLKDRAAAFYSFDKGSSTQDYPGSLMGSIALIRQSYLDGQWYKNKPITEGVNLSLQAWNEIQNLPQVFDAGSKWNVLRADKIAREFGVRYIIKAGGDEYQRLDDIKKVNTTFILPLNFPAAPDVEDPNDARMVSIAEMKHWEMAPAQPGMFEKAGINFALTLSGLQSSSDFLVNLKKAIQNGLTESKALDALTRTPATIMGMYDKVGSLDAGKLANFIITNGSVFKDSTSFYQNWVQGKKYELKQEGWTDTRGIYNLTINSRGTTKNYDVTVRGLPERIAATMQSPGDTMKTPLSLSVTDKLVRMNWATRQDMGRQNTLSGVIGDKNWSGTGYLSNGDVVQWRMNWKSDLPVDSTSTAAADTSRRGGGGFGRRNTPPTTADVLYPFNGYGWKEGQAPKQEDVLIKNATVWTNEKDGILQNTDVLLSKGKITAIGKNLSSNGARVIDGTGKHLTAGIIDEHSHIAISGGVNECTQAVTSEVRVGDVVNPEDISIYRHLAGGVTSEHLLHGSCNPIGGQTELIKLRWGSNAENLKFSNWDPFIKFALGENVKRSSSTNNTRFPDTRMGVEQVYVDAFQRALDYQKEGPNKRKDLELETLSEILNHKRFITCHSYVQSEINMLLHVADRFGFKINTFTHILEGYKVADLMKAHGVVGASTFSDWYAYKMEVQDAIAYNAAIMQKVGLVVAVNSDDAEQARHLNQEAAKTVKYGGVSEEEAFKMCTLNPAIMLHVADRVGSIKVGKDADVVLWNDHPLSVYAKPLYTLVDGAVYFDINKDAEIQKSIAQEKARLVQKILAERRNGGARPAAGGFRRPMEEEAHYD
jgi:imidazolonepropionase-like amidohydrolase